MKNKIINGYAIDSKNIIVELRKTVRSSELNDNLILYLSCTSMYIK